MGAGAYLPSNLETGRKIRPLDCAGWARRTHGREQPNRWARRWELFARFEQRRRSDSRARASTCAGYIDMVPKPPNEEGGPPLREAVDFDGVSVN